MQVKQSISVIIPVFNEDAGLRASLKALAAAGQWHEVLLVDASDDAAARDLVDELLSHPYDLTCSLSVLRDSAKGRAAQMNLGARHACGDVLLFLHADTRLPVGAEDAVRLSLVKGGVWGWFDVVLDEDVGLLWWVSRFMNMRARLTHIATGDQSIFVERGVFDRIGGYRALALMEDIDFTRRLKHIGRPEPLALRVVTSARRWRRQGPVRTILRMWWLRLQYWWGVPTEKLARQYAKR
jgi:rSAM/selenodomain-associated transferase 2